MTFCRELRKIVTFCPFCEPRGSRMANDGQGLGGCGHFRYSVVELVKAFFGTASGGGNPTHRLNSVVALVTVFLAPPAAVATQCTSPATTVNPAPPDAVVSIHGFAALDRRGPSTLRHPAQAERRRRISVAVVSIHGFAALDRRLRSRSTTAPLALAPASGLDAPGAGCRPGRSPDPRA